VAGQGQQKLFAGRTEAFRQGPGRGSSQREPWLYSSRTPYCFARNIAVKLARHLAFQSQTNEQLLHMIHTMLAAILAALLWR
jgi:hypothetical protein